MRTHTQCNIWFTFDLIHFNHAKNTALIHPLLGRRFHRYVGALAGVCLIAGPLGTGVFDILWRFYRGVAGLLAVQALGIYPAKLQ